MITFYVYYYNNVLCLNNWSLFVIEHCLYIVVCRCVLHGLMCLEL